MPVTNVLLIAGLLTQANPGMSGIESFRQGRYAEAQKALEAALASDPANREARAFLAMTLAAQRNCSPAASEFASNSDASLARMSGIAAIECLAGLGKQNDAFHLLDQLELRFPADPEVLYESAKLHRKAWDRAVFALFQKAPASWRVNQLSAEVFETEGKYAEAAAQYEKAIEKNPQALNLHFRLGRVTLLQGSSPESLEKGRLQFEEELRLNPSDAVAEYQVAQILFAQQRGQEASARYEKALALNPDFAEALVAVGKIRSQQKNYAEAAHLLERAVTLQPDNEAAHYNLMLVYRNQGRSADAMAQKKELDRLQKPPQGEFTDFLKTLGEKPKP